MFWTSESIRIINELVKKCYIVACFSAHLWCIFVKNCTNVPRLLSDQLNALVLYSSIVSLINVYCVNHIRSLYIFITYLLVCLVLMRSDQGMLIMGITMTHGYMRVLANFCVVLRVAWISYRHKVQENQQKSVNVCVHSMEYSSWCRCQCRLHCTIIMPNQFLWSVCFEIPHLYVQMHEKYKQEVAFHPCKKLQLSRPIWVDVVNNK